MNFWFKTRLFDRWRGQAALACLFLHVIELLFGIRKRLLLLRGLVIVFALLVSPSFGIAQLIACVGIVGGLPQLPLARANVEFSLKAGNLVLLRLHVSLELIGSLLRI